MFALLNNAWICVIRVLFGVLFRFVLICDSGNDGEARALFDGSISILTIQKIEKKQMTTTLNNGKAMARSISIRSIKTKSKGKKVRFEENDFETDKKFIIVARDTNANKDREYVFKCKNKEMRDRWVSGLLKYVKYYKEMQDLLVD